MISHFSSSPEISVSGYYSHISLTPLKKKQQEKDFKERGCASSGKFWFLQTCGNPLGKEDLGFLQILLPVLHDGELLFSKLVLKSTGLVTLKRDPSVLLCNPSVFCWVWAFMHSFCKILNCINIYPTISRKAMVGQWTGNYCYLFICHCSSMMFSHI